uniref:Uncharacterized protein LOC104210217 n=1 Tax=Nicotiana sylvestris TaxID=4096 RepID=A0A1U7V6K6_NICSY|nr:PREDICTED: uncharacterized protein LOC104210217 [Nicotiana sylvestris]
MDFPWKIGSKAYKIACRKLNLWKSCSIHVYYRISKTWSSTCSFLIILADEHKLLTPESYDKFVCAELPDSKKDRDLYSLVIKHMMHSPCGKLNPINICMKNNNCKFKYPKDFAEQTSKGKNSYPIYKRRRTGEAVEVRERIGVMLQHSQSQLRTNEEHLLSLKKRFQR